MSLLDQFKAGKIAVKVKTEEESKRVLLYLNDKNIKWGSGHLPVEYDNIFNNKYLVCIGNSLLNFTKLEGSIFVNSVISAAEFLGESEEEALRRYRKELEELT